MLSVADLLPLQSDSRSLLEYLREVIRPLDTGRRNPDAPPVITKNRPSESEEWRAESCSFTDDDSTIRRDT